MACYKNELRTLQDALRSAPPAAVNHVGLKKWTPLYAAASKGHHEAMRMLLSAGADPNIPNEKGWTPLMAVAQTGDEQHLKWLLHHGADPSLTSREGRTALTIASAADKSTKCTELITGV